MQGRFRSAALVAASVGVTAVVMTALQPSLVEAAGSNADTVDGFHATGCSATRIARAGKLVATCKSTGRLPNNIIAKAPDASRLGGKAPSAYLLAGQIRTRTFSCGGSTMTPGYSDFDYVTDGTFVYAPLGGVFRCNIVMPSGATVTKVSATVKNMDSTGTVTCNLSRSHLDVPTTDTDVLAQPDTVAAESGNTVTSTTTISNAVVDNAKFNYRVGCSITAGTDGGDSMGIYGVQVTYKVSAANG